MTTRPEETTGNENLLNTAQTFSTTFPSLQAFLSKHRGQEVSIDDVLCSGFFEGVIKGVDALEWSTNLLVSRKRAVHCLSTLYKQDPDQRFLADYSQAKELFESEEFLQRIDSEEGGEVFLGMC